MCETLSFQNDSLLLWLLDHKEFTPFIEFDSPDEGENSDFIIKQTLQETIDQMKGFLHTLITILTPECPTFPPLSESLHKEDKKLTHIHFFIQWYIFELRINHYKKLKEYICEFIELLEERLKTIDKQTQVIRIYSKQLINKLQEEPKSLIRLSSKDSIIVNYISSHSINYSLYSTKEQQKHYINNYLESIRPSYNIATNFIHEIDSDEDIECFLFHPDFLLYDEIRSLIIDFPYQENDHNKFTNKVAELMNHILREFSITNTIDVSVFSIIFFRAMFNMSYRLHHEFFEFNYPPNIRKSCHQFPLDLISSENHEEFKDYESMEIFISNDPFLSEATKCLSYLQFVNSPLDQLGYVHESLTYIRNYLAQYDIKNTPSLSTQPNSSLLNDIKHDDENVLDKQSQKTEDDHKIYENSIKQQLISKDKIIKEQTKMHSSNESDEITKTSINENVYSFDRVFGLFLECLLCSSNDLLENVLIYILEFSPRSFLIGPFEYSLATIQASNSHLAHVLSLISKENAH